MRAHARAGMLGGMPCALPPLPYRYDALAGGDRAAIENVVDWQRVAERYAIVEDV